MAGQSPTQRTIALYRSMGYDHVQVVERFNQYARVRQDLFGFIDVLAMGRDELVAIQATSMSNLASRVTKLEAMPAVRAWLAIPHHRVVCVGWKKYAQRVDGKWWRPTIIELSLSSGQERRAG